MESPGFARPPDLADRAGPVDVSVHQVAVQSPGKGKRAFQVHPRPRRKGPERRSGKRFGGGIREKPPLLLRFPGKAYPGNRKAGPPLAPPPPPPPSPRRGAAAGARPPPPTEKRGGKKNPLASPGASVGDPPRR